ncbi:MAG: hypothetical protein QOJ46_1525 [bacterium]|jgi:uncharacterized RDD family membrane protein YckC
MTTTQEPDPFGAAPPPVAGGPSGPRAGFWQRFAAYLLDTIILGVAQVVLRLASPTVGLVLSIIIGIAYFTLLEGGPKGQTVGKMALGIRVYDLANGGPIGYGRAFIRYIGRIASAIVILLGYFWMLWDREKQTWHDKFAGSVVVPVSAYPVT